jgi:hypothetical protein
MPNIACFCAHRWMDPHDRTLPPTIYAPFIGPGPQEMKPGTVYQCQICGRRLETPPASSRERDDHAQ